MPGDTVYHHQSDPLEPLDNTHLPFEKLGTFIALISTISIN